MTLPSPAAGLDPGDLGAASLAAAAGELIAPLADAATPRPLPWAGSTPSATAIVDVTTRHPLLLVTLLADLGSDTLVVSPAVLSPTAPAATQTALRFAPYSQVGSTLVAYVPPVDADGVAARLVLSCTATRIAADGTQTSLPTSAVRSAIRVDLVQGLLGRVLAVLMAEKQQLRRTGREITAMRTLAAAGRDALDRLGADLRCPRFADELVWDPERRSPGTRPLGAPGTLEDDVSYRARLGVLRRVRLPSPTWVDSVLNGPGNPGEPGAGAMADVGVTDRVRVDESANPLLLAFRLVAPGLADGRAELLDAIRRVHLVWPQASATGDLAHDARLVPQSRFDRVAEARAALADWQLPAEQPVAPALATALQTLRERCLQLGARPWPALVAGQQDDGGSRFELGLGALLAAPDSAQLDAAVLAAGGVAGLRPRPRELDPAGAWLLTACGLRTAERNADGTVFVSAAPMGSLVVEVSPAPDGAVPLTLTAHLQSATDSTHEAPMVDVVTALAGEHLVPAPAPAELLAAIQPSTALPELDAVLVGLDLPAVNAVPDFVQRMRGVSPRSYEIFDLGPVLTTAVLGDPAVLGRLLATAATAGASSAVPVVTGAGAVALMVGVAGLPLAGTNLTGRQTLSFRWDVRGLAGDPVELAPRRGPSVQVRLPGEGISVVSCLAQVRSGANDPYEWRPVLPSGSLLTLRQYEHLLNIVELVTPVGVRADTWTIRHHHVDVDGSGTALPLTPAAARTYRHYRTAR